MYASCTSFCRLRVCMYERQLYVNNLISLLVKFIKHNQNYYLKTLRFDLYQRPSSEEAGTEFFLFLTQREDAVSRKVVCVAQLVAALITVHGLLSFLSDVYGLFDPSGKTLWLSVDHCRLRLVDDMVLLGCMVGENGFVLCSVKFDAQRLLVNVQPLQSCVPVI